MFDPTSKSKSTNSPKPSPKNEHVPGHDSGIRILSIDGGGVSGLSSLLILEQLMKEVGTEDRLTSVGSKNPELTSPKSGIGVKPCQVFDLICGTGTGGLIALMLGQLEMVWLENAMANC